MIAMLCDHESFAAKDLTPASVGAYMREGVRRRVALEDEDSCPPIATIRKIFHCDVSIEDSGVKLIWAMLDEYELDM